MEPSKKIDGYVSGFADWRGEVLAKIRTTVLAADTGVVEEWRWMGEPVWSCDGMVAVASAHTGKVQLSFAQGVHLEDVDGLFNGGLESKEWRSIVVLEGDRLDERALLRLVKAAIAFNRLCFAGTKRNAAAKKPPKKRRA